MASKHSDNNFLESLKERQIEQISEKANLSRSQFLSIPYFLYWISLYSIGFPLALFCSWLFRKNKIISFQLFQSFILQIPFIVFNLLFSVDIFPKIFFFILWLYVLLGSFVNLGFITKFIFKLWQFFKNKSIKKAFALSFIFPGLGFIYIGRGFIGWLIFGVSVFILGILLFLTFCFYNFPDAKLFLLIIGFNLRISDISFISHLVSPFAIFCVLGLLLLLYLIGILYFYLRKNNFKFQFSVYRFFDFRIIGSSVLSGFLPIVFTLCLLLVPIVFVKAEMQENIEKRAKQIEKNLKEQIEKKKKEIKIKKITKKHSIPKNKEKLEREIAFDLEVPKRVSGTNEFPNKLLKPLEISKKPETPISYSEGNTKHIQEQIKKIIKQPVDEMVETKSYSEYITAKVRENGRDQIIWDSTENIPYSMVVEYLIDTSGNIIEINILEGSNNIEIDSIVVAVTESMAPMIMPPKGKNLRVTEMFWNTGLDENELDTQLKKDLLTYADGRFIEIVD